ncbi:MAG: hypothetical protein RLZZ303_638 [Candidatus Hydrogenedentota bacterium]|jgi:phage shock protein C
MSPNDRKYEHADREAELRLRLRVSGGARLYRSRDGMVFGVCRGLANYLEMNVTVLRVIAVVLTVMTGFWAGIIAYVVSALLMKLEPVVPLETEEDAEFYNSFTGSRKMALHRLKRTYENLDRRIQRIEGIVTARDYDWDRRLHGDS